VRDVQYVSYENAEDACAHAWLKVLQRQPDRDGERWKGWLYVTAKREAWKLNALEFKEREDMPASGAPDIVEPVDPHDRLSERIEFQAALQELRRLPPLLQEVVMVRSQVWRHADVAEAMGLSRQRVAELLVKAALRVSQLNEERHGDERPVASPRAARLRELEDEPPAWLTSAIGMRPARSKSASGVVLAWRRAALVIDDYRRAYSHDSPTDAIGSTPIEPEARREHQRAERAIAEVAHERLRRSRGMGRGD
jgi:DNA-directed RNA polymerase specialized sigma24 family protein